MLVKMMNWLVAVPVPVNKTTKDETFSSSNVPPVMLADNDGDPLTTGAILIVVIVGM